MSNYIGKCDCCGHTVRKDTPSAVDCNNCSRIGKVYHYGERRYKFVSFGSGKIYFKRIKGFKTEHKCDVRCTHATGHVCECSCGGSNHGSAYGTISQF